MTNQHDNGACLDIGATITLAANEIKGQTIILKSTGTRQIIFTPNYEGAIMNQHDKEMREAFELVISSKNVSLDKFVSGRYEDENTQSAWWGFKAAYKTSKEIYEADTTRYEAALREAKEALELSGNWMTEDAFYTAKSKALTTINEILGEK